MAQKTKYPDAPWNRTTPGYYICEKCGKRVHGSKMWSLTHCNPCGIGFDPSLKFRMREILA